MFIHKTIFLWSRYLYITCKVFFLVDSSVCDSLMEYSVANIRSAQDRNRINYLDIQTGSLPVYWRISSMANYVAPTNQKTSLLVQISVQWFIYQILRRSLQ